MIYFSVSQRSENKETELTITSFFVRTWTRVAFHFYPKMEIAFEQLKKLLQKIP